MAWLISTIVDAISTAADRRPVYMAWLISTIVDRVFSTSAFMVYMAWLISTIVDRKKG